MVRIETNRDGGKKWTALVLAGQRPGVDALAATPALAMLVGAGVCVAWAANGHLLARAQARIEREREMGREMGSE